MARSNKTVDITLRYIPDTSLLDKELKDLNKINFNFGGFNAKKDLAQPLSEARKTLKEAFSKDVSVRDTTKAFEQFSLTLDKVRDKFSQAARAEELFYNSTANQENIKALKNFRKEYELTLKSIEKWDKKYSKGSLKSFRDTYGVADSAQDRQKIIKGYQDSVVAGEDVSNIKDLYEATVKYNDLLKEMAANPKKDLEERRVALKEQIAALETTTTTEEQHTAALLTNQQVYSSLNAVQKISTSTAQENTAAVKEQVDANKELGDQVKETANILTTSIAGFSIYNILTSGIRRGIDFFKDYDEILTRTTMVTTMNRDDVDKLTNSYRGLASQLSSTIKDVASAQLIFYQQGLSTKDALNMTEAAIAVSKTGNIAAAEAADRLTSAVRGYQLAASDAMDIVDKMSALDAHAASSVDELTIAMQKSASQARMAGLDLDYYMAYLSTMQEVTREAPENIGTAMKSITARLREIKDLGKVEEDGTTFSNVAKALNSIGISALDSAGQLRSLQDIMNELGPLWKTLDTNHKAYIATTMAGNRQQSRFIALMDNYDRALELVDISQNSAGEHIKQLNDYNQGLEASLVRLQNAWQQFATTIGDSSLISNIVDVLSRLIESLSSNSVGSKLTRWAVYFTAFTKILPVIKALKNFDISKFYLSKLGLDKQDVVISLPKFKDSINKSIGQIFSGDTAAKLQGTFSRGMDRVISRFPLMTSGIQDTKKNLEELEATAKTHLDTLKGTTGQEEEFAGSIWDSTGALEGNRTAYVTEKEELQTQGSELEKNISAYKNLSKAAANIGPWEVQMKALQDSLEKVSQEYYEWGAKLQSTEAMVNEYQKTYPQNYTTAALQYAQTKKGKEHPLDETGRPNEQFIKYLKTYNSDFKAYVQAMEEARERLFEEMDRYASAIRALREKIQKITGSEDKQIAEGTGARKQEIQALNEATMANKEEAKASEEAAQTDRDEAEANRQSAASERQETGANLNTGTIPLSGVSSSGKGAPSTGPSKPGKGEFSLSQIGAGFSKAFGVYLTSQFIGGIAESITGSDVFGEVASDISLLAKATSEFGLAGTIVAGLYLAIDAGFNDAKRAAERAQKAYEEALSEWDKVNDAFTSVQKAIDTYTKLSGKLNKTTEETDELASAVEVLGEKASAAIVGIDENGNYIFDKNLLEKINEENRAKSAEAATETATKSAKASAAQGYSDLMDKNGRGWQAAGEIALGTTTAMAIGTAIGTAILPGIGTLIGAGIGVAVGLGGSIAAEKAYNQNVRYAEEYNLEVYKELIANLSTLRQSLDENTAAYIEYGDAATLQERKTAGSYINSAAALEFANLVKQGQLEAGDYDDYEKTIVTEVANLSNRHMLEAWNFAATSSAEQVTEGKSWAEMRDNFESQLDKMLKTANVSEDAISAFRRAFYSQIFSGTTNIQEINEEFRSYWEKNYKELDRSGQIQLQKYQNVLNSGNIASYDALNSANLFNVDDESSRRIVANLTDDIAKINKASIDANGNAQQSRANIALLTVLLKDMDSTMDADLVDKYKDSIQDLFNAMENPEVPSFAKIAEDVQKAVSDITDLVDIIDDLNEAGGRLSLDNFVTLFNTLDDIEASMLSDASSIDAYINAFEQLANGMSVVNGELYLNAEAVESVAEIKRLAFQQEIKQQIAEIDSEISGERLKLQLLQAEQQALLTAAETQGTAAEMEEAAKKDLVNSLSSIEATWLNNETKAYGQFAYITSSVLSTVASNWKKLQKGMSTGIWENIEIDNPTKILSSLTSQVTDGFEEALEGLYDKNVDKYKQNLKNAADALQAQIDRTTGTINALESRRKALVSIEQLAESGLGSLQKFAKGAEDSQSDYNEQLERTLSLLEKIERISHRLERLETFESWEDVLDGRKAGRYLIESLDLYQEQYDLYKDLYAMQHEAVNQAAGDLLDSPFGELFNILDNGAVTWADETSYYKYLSLNDEAQESIDELVAAFQEQRDALEETEISLQDYANALIETRNTIRDLTIEAENTILDAVKNREQILHDARVKALNDEIEMIQKAVDARNKANSRDQQYKDLYQAQEKLRRATLDSSGKNNSTLLQLQQDLEDKLLEIQEQRFSDDMDDRKQWLQDSKDAETESYEYRLETMTWYWEEVTKIMEGSTENIMEFLKKWHQDYRIESATARAQLEEEWESTFDKLKEIADMGVTLERLREDFSKVTSEVENMGIKVEALTGRYKDLESAANKAATATGKVGNGSSGYTNSPTSDSPKDEMKLISQGNFTSGAGFGGGGGGGAVIPSMSKATNTLDSKKGNITLGSSVTVPAHATLYDSTGAEVASSGAKKTGRVTDILKGNYGYLIKLDKDSLYYGSYIPNPLSGTAVNLWEKIGHGFKTGGLVDYTGPAWVDGTYSKPEAFLNPYQTQQIGALANALSSNSISAISGDSNITFGSINFNVASMSSAADGKKALEAFVQGANDMMAKKGIGTKLNLNVR